MMHPDGDPEFERIALIRQEPPLLGAVPACYLGILLSSNAKRQASDSLVKFTRSSCTVNCTASSALIGSLSMSASDEYLTM